MRSLDEDHTVPSSWLHLILYPLNLQLLHLWPLNLLPLTTTYSLQFERDVLYELRGCAEILQCFGEDVSVENGVEVYNLLLEYAPGGTLEDVIQSRRGRMMESEVSCYVSMILKGLSHVHEEGYVHCDLKPCNILVFPQENMISFLKLADFGLAKKSCQITKRLGLHKNRGTLLYSSPESVAYGEHEAAMDIWSVGCIMVEMLFRTPVWSIGCTVEELELKIAYFKDEFLRFLPQCLSEIAKDFLGRCLTRNVKDRWTADQLLRHPFITENVVSVPESCSKLMAYPKSPFESCVWLSTQCLFS